VFEGGGDAVDAGAVGGERPNFGAGVLIEIGGRDPCDGAFVAGEDGALGVVVERAELIGFEEMADDFDGVEAVLPALDGSERVVAEEPQPADAAVVEELLDEQGFGGADGPRRDDGVRRAGVVERPNGYVGEAESTVGDSPYVEVGVKVAEDFGGSTVADAELGEFAGASPSRGGDWGIRTRRCVDGGTESGCRRRGRIHRRVSISRRRVGWRRGTCGA